MVRIRSCLFPFWDSTPTQGQVSCKLQCDRRSRRVGRSNSRYLTTPCVCRSRYHCTVITGVFSYPPAYFVGIFRRQPSKPPQRPELYVVARCYRVVRGNPRTWPAGASLPFAPAEAIPADTILDMLFVTTPQQHRRRGRATVWDISSAVRDCLPLVGRSSAFPSPATLVPRRQGRARPPGSGKLNVGRPVARWRDGARRVSSACLLACLRSDQAMGVPRTRQRPR